MKQLVLGCLLALPLFCGAKIRTVAITDGQPDALAPDTSASKPNASFHLKLPPNTVGLVYLISAAFINAYLFPGIVEGSAVNSVRTGNYLAEYSRSHYSGGAAFVPVGPLKKAMTMLLNVENVSSVQAIQVVVEAVALVDDSL